MLGSLAVAGTACGAGMWQPGPCVALARGAFLRHTLVPALHGSMYWAEPGYHNHTIVPYCQLCGDCGREVKGLGEVIWLFG
jgi:hypothetical protein